MGMFDTVEFRCPSCGTIIEVQSKAGPCILDRHNEAAVPAAIAGDVLGEKVSCHGCSKDWQVASYHIIRAIPMFLEPVL